jgi:hypothetical protein
MSNKAKYNGWKNRQTWNCALWIGNDEGLYRSAVDFMKSYEGEYAYNDFIRSQDLSQATTPDGVHWLDSGLDHDALDDMMCELA